MQIKKTYILNDILESATEEFLVRSYAKASLTRIASNSNLSRGALYTYFKSKEDLFDCLCKPGVDLIRNNLTVNIKANCIKLSKKFMADKFKLFSFAVKDNLDSLKLLFFCSGGSRYENFKEEIILMYSKAFPIWALGISDYTNYMTIYNDMLIHTISNTYISFIEEIILHDPNEKDLIIFCENISSFIYSGICAIKKEFKEKKLSE